MYLEPRMGSRENRMFKHVAGPLREAIRYQSTAVSVT
jgi:hypothetical protein